MTFDWRDDELLRRKGYRVRSRPKSGPTLWLSPRGAILEHNQAMEIEVANLLRKAKIKQLAGDDFDDAFRLKFGENVANPSPGALQQACGPCE